MCVEITAICVQQSWKCGIRQPAVYKTTSLALSIQRRDKSGYVCSCFVVAVWSVSCVWPCKPMDCSPQGFSVHEISQARILEWVAISFSRRSFWPRDWTCVSCKSPALQVDSLPLSHQGSSKLNSKTVKNYGRKIDKGLLKVPPEALESNGDYGKYVAIEQSGCYRLWDGSVLYQRRYRRLVQEKMPWTAGALPCPASCLPEDHACSPDSQIGRK